MEPNSGVILRMTGGPDALFEDVDELGFSRFRSGYEYDVQPSLTPIFTKCASASMPGEGRGAPRVAMGVQRPVKSDSYVIDLSEISASTTARVAGTPLAASNSAQRVRITVRSSAGWYSTVASELWAMEFFTQLACSLKIAISEYGLQLNEALVAEIGLTHDHPLLPLVTEQDEK